MNKRQVLLATGGVITSVFVIFFTAGTIQEWELQGYACKPTPSNPEGPYYIEGAPFKEIFGKGLEGDRLHLRGKILDEKCNPIKGAVIDLWHTDSQGNYDHSGYVLRGKVRTGSDGSYFLDTVFPEKYSEAGIMRPRHIHVKVQVPNEPVLTTQLYFEGDPDRDIFVKDELVMSVTTNQNGLKSGSFDFIIKTKSS